MDTLICTYIFAQRNCTFNHVDFFVFLVQLLLGLPLEIVHGPLRIGVIYLAGALSGSLLTSITDPDQFLAGASGGVYALMLAHLPTLIMNWRQMKTFFEWFLR